MTVYNRSTRQYRNDVVNKNIINHVRNKYRINRNNGSFQEKNLMLLNKQFLRQLEGNLDPNPYSDINVRIFKYNNMQDRKLQNKLRVFVLTSPIRWEALRTILGSKIQANTRKKIDPNNRLLNPIINAAMEDIFKEVFFNNLSFNDDEIDFLIDKMFVDVTILHPIKKKELACAGKVNDYELK